MISLSKAKLEYASGMHLQTIAQEEFEIEGDWFRAECFRDDEGNLRYAGYTTIGAYWREVMTDADARNASVGALRVLHAIGNRLVQRARLANGELQLL